MAEVKKRNENNFMIGGFGVRFVKGITDEEAIIKGGSIFLFNKQILTIAICNTDWVDEQGIPYKFKLDGNVLFIKNIAIGFLNINKS